MNSESEKRGFSRVECLVDLELTVLQSKSQVHKVEAVDLSLSGVGLSLGSTIAKLEPGQRVLVRIYGIAPVEGEVCWHYPGRSGIRFTEPVQNVAESWVGELLAITNLRVADLVPQDPQAKTQSKAG